jgi:hypothetical protein
MVVRTTVRHRSRGVVGSTTQNVSPGIVVVTRDTDRASRSEGMG